MTITTAAPEGWVAPVLEWDEAEPNYPSEEALELIEHWPHDKAKELLEAVRGIWMYATSGYWNVDEVGAIHASTAGWSGNESIISAMEKNIMIWSQVWIANRRGGHYIFGTGYACYGGNSDSIGVKFVTEGR